MRSFLAHVSVFRQSSAPGAPLAPDKCARTTGGNMASHCEHVPMRSTKPMQPGPHLGVLAGLSLQICRVYLLGLESS